jgi:pilus assembly protein CpaF
MLPDGSRLHVVIPDITRRHWSVNIRKFVLSANSLDELVALGTLTAQAARFLEAAVVAGLNVIVAGGTQAGKTTLLNCLASAIPGRERVVTCEEVFDWIVHSWDGRAPAATLLTARATGQSQRRQRAIQWPAEVSLRHLSCRRPEQREASGDRNERDTHSQSEPRFVPRTRQRASCREDPPVMAESKMRH